MEYSWLYRYNNSVLVSRKRWKGMGMERQNRFKLGEILGKGSCGTVYEGVLTQESWNIPEGTPVAIKVIHPELLQSSRVMARLRREVEIGMRVKSDFIVSIFGIEQTYIYGNLTLAVIMELIQGTSLSELLRKKGMLPEGFLLAIAREMACALRDIHRLGIIHRDVKPSNIIIRPDRHVVLTDLGIARLPDFSAKVTATGTFIGTCSYASPEQFCNTELLDPRSDLYSLGVVLYEMGTGINPFRTGNLVSSIQMHLKGEIDPPSHHNPLLGPMFDELVMSLLAKNREDRPSSSEKLIELLESLGTDADETAVM